MFLCPKMICKDGKCVIYQKYIVCIMICLSLILLYGTRYALTACIHHKISISQPGIIIKPGQSVCLHFVEPEDMDYVETIDWTKTQQYYVYSSFYLGYAVLPIFSGTLADIYGAKYLLSTSVLACAFITVLQPTLLTTKQWYWSALLQGSLGILQGIAVPAIVSLLAQWLPESHQTLLISCGYSGGCLGAALCVSLCMAFICVTDNWTVLFYSWAGAIGIWYVIFMLVIHSRPAVHPCVTPEEQSVMANEVGLYMPKSIPWKPILTNAGVWGIVCGHLADTCLMVLINIHLPELMLFVLSMDHKDTGYIFLSGFIGQWVFILLCGCIADVMVKKDYPRHYVRHVCVTVGNIFPGCMLGMVANIGCKKVLISCIVISLIILRGATVCALTPSILDITRHYSGVVKGINCTVLAMVGVILPQIVSRLCWKNTLEAWERLLWLTVVFCFTMTCFYVIFCKRNRADWDVVNQDMLSEEVKNV